MKTSFSVNDWTPGKSVSPLAAVFRLPILSVSMPLPPLPMTMPGRAVKTMTLHLLAARSISTPAMPAFCRYSLTARLMRMSSWSHLA